MMRKLHEADREAILSYAYEREMENMFVIGSFTKPEPFEKNRYFGAFTEGKLQGISTWFGPWQSFVVHAQEQEDLRALTDALWEAQVQLSTLPVFRRYGVTIMERLREKGMVPRSVSEQRIYTLKRAAFQARERAALRAADTAAEMASESDREAIARMYQEPLDPPPTERELRRIIPEETSVVRVDGTVVSMASIHAISRHYAQIGGVQTLPQHRRKGYARQAVSRLCRECFARGIESVMLFASNENVPALALYRSMGFVPGDDFLIATYDDPRFTPQSPADPSAS